MIFVQEEFNRLTGQEVTSDVIWKYLDTIYDMDALVCYDLLKLSSILRDFNISFLSILQNENDDLPFSNKQIDFVLPNDYQTSSMPISQPLTPATPTKSPSKSIKYSHSSTWNPVE